MRFVFSTFETIFLIMQSRLNISEYLKPLAWDVNLTVNELEDLYFGKKSMIGGVTSENIYVKLLGSYNWYTLLKIIENEKLRELLSDNVISKLKSKSLQQKYFYARSVLF